MPRLIRRRPWLERIKARLNVLDILLWFFEELDSGDWDQWQAEWATSIGIVINIVFLVARANSGSVSRQQHSDVFGDDLVTSPGLVAWLVKAPPLRFLPMLRSNTS